MVFHLKNKLKTEPYYENEQGAVITPEHRQSVLNLGNYNFAAISSSKYKIKEIFSPMKGRCYTIVFENIDAKKAFSRIKVKAPKELVAFVHEPGAEILLSGIPSDLFIYGSPPIEMGSEGFFSMILSKKIVIKKENCIEDENYDYYGL